MSDLNRGPLAEAGDSANMDRRAALQKLGAYSALTAPVLLAVLTADKAIAQSSGSPIRGDCTTSPPSCKFS
jgi:hypothetical protein